MINSSRRFIRTLAGALAIGMAWTSIGAPRVEAMMAPTRAVSQAITSDRAGDLRTVRSMLENRLVRQRLADMGLSAEQVDSRVQKLDDARLHQIAMKIEKQNPAGDAVVGILVIALLVVLLVYLVERI